MCGPIHYIWPSYAPVNLYATASKDSELTDIDSDESNILKGLITYEQAAYSLKAISNNRSSGSSGFLVQIF